jgi:predicted nucleic acid-binding protein
MILVDTSILGRLASFKSALHTKALRAVHFYLAQQQEMCIAPQSVYEFWVVATRPVDVNGFGWTPRRAVEWITYFESFFRLLPEVPDLYLEWRRLVQLHETSGKPAHDARLVACMNVYAISEILTFNGGDFTRYGVTVIDPANLK